MNEQVLIRKKRKIVEVPDKLKTQIEIHNLLPLWLEFPETKFRDSLRTEWNFEFDGYHKYEWISEEWVNKAYYDLADIALLSYKAEEFLNDKLVPLKHLVDILRKEINPKENNYENIYDELRETNYEVKFFETAKKNIEFQISNFQRHILGNLKVEIIDQDESIAFFKEKYGLQKLKKYFYESMVKLDDFLKLKWDFYYLLTNLRDHPSTHILFEKSKRERPTKQQAVAVSSVKIQFEEIKTHLPPYYKFIKYFIDENGVAQPKIDGFYESILGQDVRRVRQCLYCSNIFWAGRLDKFCCSVSCNRAENLRLLPPLTREKRDAINKLRRDNYDYKFSPKTPKI